MEHASAADGTAAVRNAAVSALVKIAGDAGAIAAVSAQLEDASPVVRKCAVEALAKIAEKGDAGAIAAVTTRFHDGDT